MRSTMQDFPLTIGGILRHGTHVHPDAEVVTATTDGTRSMTYADLGTRAAKLASGLRSLGITGDQRVATFQWNNAEHLEAYFAVPSMGAVLHTLNIRLFPEQLTYVANHAEDQVLIVDDSLVDLLARVLPTFETVRQVLVAGPDAASVNLDALRATGKEVGLYADLLAEQDDGFEWPDVDERDAAAMCYTSGTTGSPKGVVYSHRSAYLHSMASGLAVAGGIGWWDRVLPIVPMFHANAWGMAYAAVMTGASLAMPDRWLQAEPLVRFIERSRPTVSGAVPTVWNDVVRYLEMNDGDLSSLRLVLCGGSAVPVALQKTLQERHDITMIQAWGMTETSPVASVARPPVGVEGEEMWRFRGTAGRVLPGVEARIVGDAGTVLPADGESVGELEVRGPWVTAAYYRAGDDAEARAKFRDGWLRTGDVGTLDRFGYITLTDRAKDVIKSGGEWISSVDLENALMAHPDVVEAAVVGIPDEKWQERPLASVVLREGATVTPAELRDHLSGTFASWQLPDAWTFIEAVPRTSVGKFDKKVIRRWYGDGELEVVQPAE